jgi:bifunctional DNA-binding transcriptional regulator/antitoxin component of YhaV-PrlF toxin-antitoxin module
MQINLKQIGESFVFVIPKEIRQNWNHNEAVPLEIFWDNNELIVKPAQNANRETMIVDAIKEAAIRYGATFRRLA